MSQLAEAEFECPNLVGRYVSISKPTEPLLLAEVEVFGEPWTLPEGAVKSLKLIVDKVRPSVQQHRPPQPCASLLARQRRSGHTFGGCRVEAPQIPERRCRRAAVRVEARVSGCAHLAVPLAGGGRQGRKTALSLTTTFD